MRLTLFPGVVRDWEIEELRCKEMEELRRKLKALRRRLTIEESYRKRQRTLLMFAFRQLNFEHVKYKDLLSLEGIWRRDRRLPRACLNNPEVSAWQAVYNSQNDQAFITVTGFDVNAFNELLGKFAPFFNDYTPWTGENDGATFCRVKKTKGGRPRLVTAASCLGLTLAYFRFKGAECEN